MKSALENEHLAFITKGIVKQDTVLFLKLKSWIYGNIREIPVLRSHFLCQHRDKWSRLHPTVWYGYTLRSRKTDTEDGTCQVLGRDGKGNDHFMGIEFGTRQRW